MRYAVADTSFLIDAFERKTSRAHDRLEEILGEVAAGRLTLVAPAPVVAELYRGAAHDPGLVARYDRLLAACQIREVNEARARLAAAIAAGADLREARSRARPGIVDSIVAQAAEELGAELVTTDPHFRLFAGAQVTVLSSS